MNKKAIIAMSGGVDSSVAAFLMKEKGYECIGATMKLFQNEDVVVCREHTCCSLDDVEDARSVARALEMPYYVFNFSDRFKEEVMEKFVCSYENGCTPNPCIDCNRYLKFEKLFQRAKELSYDYVVTGHYAQIEYNEETGRYLLKKIRRSEQRSELCSVFSDAGSAGTCAVPVGWHAQDRSQRNRRGTGIYQCQKA